MKRTYSKPHSFDERLAIHAHKLKAEAKLLPAGQERDALLQKIQQIEVAVHVNEWLRSPGLQPPR